MVRKSLFLMLIALGGASQVHAEPADLSCKPNISLSQKDVAEIVLKQGRKTKEINFQYQQLRLTAIQALAAYQWGFTATSGYLFDKSVTMATSYYNKQENITTDILLEKNFITGTYMSVEYKKISFKGDPNSLSATTRSVATQDLLGLNIEQNLWADFFGIADRADVDSADLSYKSSLLLRSNDLENLVLDTIRSYWTSYVAEQNFKEAMASRERSKRLMDAVKKKSGFGYANPGELAQAQADYEARVQEVKDSSTTYLATLDTMNTLLGLPQGCEVKFVVSQTIPPVPQLPEKSIDDLRVIRSEKLKVQSAQRAYDSAKSRDAVTAKVVGKMYTYGIDDTSGGSYSDMVSGTHPQYYVGVKLQYSFGADLLGETRVNRKYAKDLEEVRLNRVAQEASDSLVQAQRKVQSTYAAVLSSIEQRKYREKALQELNRSYTQGRTDISIYITAMNQLTAAEIQYGQSIGNYQTALNEWAAVRDELIPEAQGE